MKKKCTMSVMNSKPPASDSDFEHETIHRVKELPNETKASIRATQVIGSLSRAIEELVRNSIEHGRATLVDVKVGMFRAQNGPSTLLEVKDNGVGIDAKSTEKWIGMSHCSSSDSRRNGLYDRGNTSTITTTQQSLKGETLKSLAALSVEFRISTSSRERIENEEEAEIRVFSMHTAPSAPSKSRKRKLTRESNSSHVKQLGELITSEKVIRNGSIVSSFQSTRNHTLNLQSSDTGTTVQLYGLFHKFAVRKRQYEICSQSQNDKSLNRIRMRQARSCIQVLALAFPNVSIRLYDTGSKNIDTCWNRAQIRNCSYLESMKHRLKESLGGRLDPHHSMIDVQFSERSANLSRKFLTATKNRNGWSLQGVLCVSNLTKPSSYNTNGSMSERLTGSISRNEFVFVNGKLSKQNASLGELIHKISRSIMQGEHTSLCRNTFLARISIIPVKTH